MKNFIRCLILVIYFSPAYANSTFFIEGEVAWPEKPQLLDWADQKWERWTCRSCVHESEHPWLPALNEQLALPSHGRIYVEVVEAEYEDFQRQALPGDTLLANNLQFTTKLYRHRNRYTANIRFIPIVKEGSRYRRLVNYRLRVRLEPRPSPVKLRNNEYVNTSVLGRGTNYKIAVSQSGMVRLSYDFLNGELGMNLNNVDPRQIKVFGYGGGMLPVNIDAPRIDDLAENAIQIVGEEDGSFDPGDYLLFYAQGPDQWVYAPDEQAYRRVTNIYERQNFYFLQVSPGNGRRISEQASLSATDYTTEQFDDFARFEENTTNILHESDPAAGATGSGQEWFGELFRNDRTKEYPNVFSFPGRINSEPVRVRVRMALRANQQSRFNVDVNGVQVVSNRANGVPLSGGGTTLLQSNYYNPALINEAVMIESENISMIVDYPRPGGGNDGSEGWLDFLEVNVRRQLRLYGNQTTFRDVRSVNFNATTYQIDGVDDQVQVWDITDPQGARRQNTTRSGSELIFGAESRTLRTFVAFRPQNLNTPVEAIGPIANQNLHALSEEEMVIIYHPDFEAEALRLAEHRRSHSGLRVQAATIDQVYHEFSSGRQDPTAIRNFARMLYLRNPQFNYLLLFGDGSFDNQDVYGLGANFIVTYQTRESQEPIDASPSDDYFALLETTDPDAPLDGLLNIAIGRLPVKTPEEARVVVDKIIHYETAPPTFSDWRNRLLFFADDEDGNIHIRDTDNIAELIGDRHPEFNQDKIYFDAFPQVSTPGGTRYPEATEALNRAIFKGQLITTYLGHGGEEGLGQERVLNISDITSWRNYDALTLFMTATCSFTAFDNAAFVTAGEEVLLNPRGGGVALLTTTRAVFAAQNADLTESTLVAIFERENGQVRRLGEAMRVGKNRIGGTRNKRKFALIGDPALRLAIPEYQVVTTKINDRPVDSTLDTLGALKRVTVEGYVANREGQKLNDFNGTLFPSVFDKVTVNQTLGQDANSFVRDYELQKNVIFRGRASVTGGDFSFTFVVPKDINYAFGNGKISYYASNGQQLVDASGSTEQLIIGGSESDVVDDQRGPEVGVFMNTPDFVFGGVTDANPTLLVQLQDENGINVVGNSIGHDLEAIIDDDTQNSILLNEFFEAELDDFTTGEARFPLNELEEGLHNIRVKAWDVANNSSEGYTEFVVAPSGAIALEHVLNYPNPFTDRTCFQFDHNMANQELDILIQIFTISGRLVKTIETTMFSDGAIRQDDCIEWDGRDDFGDPLARGVYLYKVRVRTAGMAGANLSGESEFEKLVLLK